MNAQRLVEMTKDLVDEIEMFCDTRERNASHASNIIKENAEMSMSIVRLRTELDRKKEIAVESDRHNSYLYKKNREQLDTIIELEIKLSRHEDDEHALVYKAPGIEI